MSPLTYLRKFEFTLNVFVNITLRKRYSSQSPQTACYLLNRTWISTARKLDDLVRSKEQWGLQDLERANCRMLERRLLHAYKNHFKNSDVTKSSLKIFFPSFKRRRPIKHPFFRKLEQEEVQLYLKESQNILSLKNKQFDDDVEFNQWESRQNDTLASEQRAIFAGFKKNEGIEHDLLLMKPNRSSLCIIDILESQKYCLPIPRDERPLASSLFHFLISRHQDLQGVAWRMLHLAVERLENTRLNEVLGLDDGFNHRVYFLFIHIWMLHRRLVIQQQHHAHLHFSTLLEVDQCMISKARLYENPLLTPESSIIPAKRPKFLEVAVSSNESLSSLRILFEKLVERYKTPANESSPACLRKQESIAASEISNFESNPRFSQWNIAKYLHDKNTAISGEIIDEFLFRYSWDLVKDWLKMKRISEVRFEHELRNVQEYVFGLLVCLDESVLDNQIYPSRLKEALWANVHSGDIPFSSDCLSYLTAYVIRQLQHTSQIQKKHFYEGFFTWCHFPAEKSIAFPKLVPPLQQQIEYGGYKAKNTFNPDGERNNIMKKIKNMFRGKSVPEMITKG